MRRLLLSSLPLVALSLAAVVTACGESQPPKAPCASCPEPAAAVTAPAVGAATPEEAKKFLDQVDRDLRRLWVARDRAGWANQNFITDDTEALAAAGEEATAAYISEVVAKAKRFDGVKLDPVLQRQLQLLKLTQVVPAPANAEERGELAKLQSEMTATYGKGEYCPPAGSPLLRGPAAGGKNEPAGAKKRCLKLDDLSRIMKSSHNESELLEAWKGWHAIAPVMKDNYARYAELGNKGAKEVGFADMGALWRSGYDMSPQDFEADIERLWGEVKPLYDDLHCYTRKKLRTKYGKDKVGDKAAIPAHLLGNMWAQEWGDIYDMIEPFPGQGSLDVDKKLVAKKYEPKKMVQLGESFFTSLGLDPLPSSFWERSLFHAPEGPRGRLSRERVGRLVEQRSPHQDVHRADGERSHHDPSRARSRLLLPLLLQAPPSSFRRARTTASTRASATPSRSPSRRRT